MSDAGSRDLKLSIRGKVLNGRYQGWFILIEPASDLAFYLFFGRDDPRRGFDSWFATREELAVAMAELGEIEWLDS